MRSLTNVLLSLLLLTTPLWLTADDKTGDNTTDPASGNVSASGSASKAEVEQLRKELAEQRKTIEELKAMVQQLTAGKPEAVSFTAPAPSAPAPAPAAAPAAAPMMTAVVATPREPGDVDEEEAEASQRAAQANASPMPSAGWNGEHFFLRSPDGTFTILPVGYLNTAYTAYTGDGAPPNTFSLRRARFGFLGTYGSKVDYAFLFDTASTNGISIRDMYINFKPTPAFQIQGGQFKEPFSQEVGVGDTNLEFNERSIISVLYPSATGAFRSPGLAVHGDIRGGVVQYWGGIFNGKGILNSNTTNEPEVVGRLRFSPWRNKKNSLFQGFSLGGSIAHGRTTALSNELSFSGALNDGAYTFFPQFRINGGIERYNGEFLWLKGPWALRGEYTQILEKRDDLGSFAVGGAGFEDIPGVVGKGAYLYTTYLLSGEREPENAIPRVKHPVIGPPTPGVENSTPGWGSWQIKFRYSWLEGKAGGQNFDSQFTPVNVTPFSDHTDQFSTGFNWYINYWVLVKLDLNLDRLTSPSVQGIVPQNYFVVIPGLQFRF
jgi:phosphate-selective porin